MTDDEAAEVRAAMALPGWEWRAGMRDAEGRRIEGDAHPGWCSGAGCHSWHGDNGEWGKNRCERHAGRSVVLACGHDDPLWADLLTPDPHDDATAGVLLGMLDGWPERLDAERWVVVDQDYNQHEGEGPSLGMAVIRCALARGRWGTP
jgi:hypothetical protein